MRDDALRSAIEAALECAGGDWRRVGATGWGEAWSLALADGRCFVKVVRGERAGMLAGEADGLRAIADTGTVRVPAVYAEGIVEDTAYLVLEWLDLHDIDDQARLGRALAALHDAETASGPEGERFGWYRDNWIGGTPQQNRWSDDWPAFFREVRLAPQFLRAFRNGFRDLEHDAKRLLARLPELLGGRDVMPALVHGDLWSGNAASLAGGEPVVFDPAVYIGDREVDLAMSELFGGFGAVFRSGYESVSRVEPGYAQRRDVYNLYHLLNHLNLFGGSYLARTARTLARLVA